MSSVRVSAADLAQMETDELMALFSTLEAPPIDELNGEYAGRMLRQPFFLCGVWWVGCLRNPIWPGWWGGKAFRPISPTEGRGYNTFRHLGRTVERFPMRTLLAPSRYDRKPAFQIVYRAYHSVCGAVHMVDEVRRVADGAYLLIGTMGFNRPQRQVPNPFLLTGPTGPYRTDIGLPRDHYAIEEEIPAWNHPAD